MHCILHTDGGARGNPGPAGLGVVIRDADSQSVLFEAGFFLQRATNNVAEYEALLHGLKAAADLGVAKLSIRSDSELMVRQLQGRYRVKSADLKPRYEQAVRLLKPFDWDVQHVRRADNARADELANMAMDARRDVTRAVPDAAVAEHAASNDQLCFSAQLKGRQGRCLAGCSTGNAYTFGPTTPEGFCLHGAAAALTDGPLQWPDRKRTGRTRCEACGLNVEIERIR